MEKSEIRARMKGLNRSLDPRRRADAARNIAACVESTEAFAKARVVALFASLPDEPPTDYLLLRWAAGRRIVLPRVEGDTMRFFACDGGALERGAFGILEPCDGCLCDPASIDLILVPGVAFTASGQRLGRGRGYYDRYLSQPGFRAFKVGVCYAHQIVETLPCEPHDVAMDAVVAG